MKKNISSLIISEINENFINHQLNFITDIFTIENKTVPKFKDNNELLQIYCVTKDIIINELMYHRNKPITYDRLCKLHKISSLPESLIIILNSIK